MVGLTVADKSYAAYVAAGKAGNDHAESDRQRKSEICCHAVSDARCTHTTKNMSGAARPARCVCNAVSSEPNPINQWNGAKQQKQQDAANNKRPPMNSIALLHFSIGRTMGAP